MLNLVTLINVTKGRNALFNRVKVETVTGQPLEIVAVRLDPQGNIILSAVERGQGSHHTAWKAYEGVR